MAAAAWVVTVSSGLPIVPASADSSVAGVAITGSPFYPHPLTR